VLAKERPLRFFLYRSSYAHKAPRELQPIACYFEVAYRTFQMKE